MKTQAQWLEKEEKTREGVRTDVSWLETGVQRNKSLQSEKKKKKKCEKEMRFGSWCIRWLDGITD